MEKAEFSKPQILSAIRNTYNNSIFVVGTACSADVNFYHKAECFDRKACSKQELLTLVAGAEKEIIPAAPNLPGCLALSEQQCIFTSEIAMQQKYMLTVPVEGFTHVFSYYYPRYDVYYRVDRDEKQITFALGDTVRSFPVREDPEWAWNVTGECLLCDQIERLEQRFQTPYWGDIPVKIGRTMLGIPQTLHEVLEQLERRNDMTYWNQGEIQLLDGKTTDALFWEILDLHGLNFVDEEERTEETVLSIGEYPGDIEDDLTAAVKELFENGYRLQGSIACNGSYEANYEIQPDGTVRSLSREESILESAKDEELIHHLESRGYSVQKHSMSMEMT